MGISLPGDAALLNEESMEACMFSSRTCRENPARLQTDGSEEYGAGRDS